MMDMEYFTNPLALALVKVTVLLLLTLSVSQLIKKPAARAILLTCSIIACPLVLALSFTHPLIDIIPANIITQSDVAPERTTIGLESAPIISTEYYAPSDSDRVESVGIELGDKESNLPILVLYTVFTIGCIIMLFPMLASFWKIFNLKKLPASGRPLKIWNKLFQPKRKEYSLFFIPSKFGAFAHGVFSPKVMLPNDSTKWSDQKLHATLIHEVAHLRRRDPFTRMLSFVVRAILWFHPLAWIAHRQLIQAQEESCDQAALASGITAADYAEELLSSASYSTYVAQDALTMARWSQIGKRINHIINQQPNNTTNMKTILTIITVTVATAFTIATTGLAQEVIPAKKQIDKEDPAEKKAEKVDPAKKKEQVAEVRKLLYKGVGFFDYGKNDEASNEFRKVLKIDPNCRAAHRWLEKINAAKKKAEKVDPAKKKEQVAEVRKLLYKGVGFFDYGKNDEASNEFRKVLKIDPNCRAAHRWLEKINAAKKKAEKVDPAKKKEQVAEVRKLLYKGVGFFDYGKNDEASNEFRKVLVIDPDNMAAHRWIAKINAAKKKAENVLPVNIGEQVNKMRRLLHGGELLFNLGKHDEASNEFRKVLVIDPDNMAAHRWIAKTDPNCKETRRWLEAAEKKRKVAKGLGIN